MEAPCRHALKYETTRTVIVAGRSKVGQGHQAKGSVVQARLDVLLDRRVRGGFSALHKSPSG